MKNHMTLTNGLPEPKELTYEKKLGGDGHERIADLLGRLKKFDRGSQSFKLDFLSIPESIRMVLRIFPHRYCRDPILREGALRAFVSTVIPGSDEHEEHLIAMFEDSYYPFHTFSGYFVFDLNRRSRALFTGRTFANLSPDERTVVLQNALEGRELTRRLYKGAILMAQVSYFGAVYDEERGCPLIDFPGRNEGYGPKQTTYPFSSVFFHNELSIDGHPW